MDSEVLEHLLARCALKDQSALRLLYDKTSSYLNAVAYRLLGSADKSDEVLQDAYIQIWQKADTYSSAKAAPLTWMASIVRYRAIDYLRSEKRHQNRVHQEIEEEVLLTTPAPQNEEGRYELFRLNKQLRACLEEMNETFRKCLELAYLQGYSREELAQELDAKVNTVKSWLRRGSSSLKQCMDQNGGSPNAG